MCNFGDLSCASMVDHPSNLQNSRLFSLMNGNDSRKGVSRRDRSSFI
jgi:hypothetical protein